jgi:protein-arginine kinase
MASLTSRILRILAVTSGGVSYVRCDEAKQDEKSQTAPSVATDRIQHQKKEGVNEMRTPLSRNNFTTHSNVLSFENSPKYVSDISNSVSVKTEDVYEDDDDHDNALDPNEKVVDNKHDVDSYPNFSRHGKSSLLPKYLTKDVYMELKDKQTKNGVRLEDIIQAGVSLPYGANPPRGIAGVFAGDPECYHTFSKLFEPLVEEFHHTRRGRNMQQARKSLPAASRQRRSLQRFQSNLNPQHLLTHQLDPEGAYILYTRMRLARSISGFRFGPGISRSERRAVETLLKTCVDDWNHNKHNKLTGGKYISLLEMSNSQHEDLIQRRLLFRDPNEFDVSAGLARDWPDARGIFCDDWEDTSIMIWVNAEDHLWIISNSKGGDVQGVFTKLSQAVWALETSLKHLGHSFVEDKTYGFLNTCPSNIGPALKASVYVKLPRVSRQPGFYKLIRKLRLEANSSYEQSDKRFTGIYDIANAEALGKSEVELINIMIRGVGSLIEFEKKLERGEEVDLYAEIERLRNDPSMNVDSI